MRHIYLSPHLDDAVLSCGGVMHRQAAAGDDVHVVTLLTADVPRGAALSPFARRLHREWGGHPEPYRLRRAEDLAALTLLRVEAHHLDALDAIYRRTPGGEWPYIDNQTLFGEVHADDPLKSDCARQLLSWLGPASPDGTVYAPLAVGRHVDHQIVHAAAREFLARGLNVAFYEDFPYAAEPGAVETALAAAGAVHWRPEVIPLSADGVALKASALGYYRSQIPIIFGGLEAMISRVWAFAATRSRGANLAERIWWP